MQTLELVSIGSQRLHSFIRDLLANQIEFCEIQEDTNLNQQLDELFLIHATD
jgi:hypothetical protein